MIRPLRPLMKFTSLYACLLAATLLAGAPAFASPVAPDTAPQARQSQDDKPKLLTDDDIELLKVYEVDLNPTSGKPPRITIPGSALKQFLKEYREDDRIPRGKDQKAFLKSDGHKQLALLFELRARNYYKHVRVRTPIESLREWDSLHSQYIQGYFQPHFGAGKVPGVYLIPKGRDEKRIAMTNFYILTQTRLGGTPMIDRDTPEDSLLLQWGLPREDGIAKFAAPDVEGWKPYFKDKEDARFKEMVQWIESLVRENQGSTYGIKYDRPEPDAN